MAKRKIRRKTVSTKSRDKPDSGSTKAFLLFISTRLFAGLVFAALMLLLYLDLEIRQRFGTNIQSQPAHVFTRPLQLVAGTVFKRNKLADTLEGSGYRRIRQISNPGDFAVASGTLDVYLRGFDTGIVRQKPQAVRIRFGDDTIISLTDHSNAQVIDHIVIEPLLIGSLQMGSYQDRISLKLHQMPELLLRALLAMEDRNFESHIGVDPKAIARALWANLRGGKAIQGGSTLTQQLVKNLFLNPKRTLLRKATEAMMAIMMEIRFSKSEILELYLNEIFLGQSGNRAVHGFALASEYYFGRSVDQLKLHEMSLLVAMIPAPSFYNPRRHPLRALKRRNLVLQTLADLGAISPSRAQTTSELPLGIIPHKTESTSDFPAYLDYLHRQLRQYYSEEVLRTNGLRLYTSLDAGIQQIAQQGLSETLHRLGIERHIQNYPSTLLGASQHTPLEVAQMYQTLANNGIRIPLRSIHSIHNHRGETIANFPLIAHRVIDQNSAFLIDFALKQVVVQGTASGLSRSFSPALGLRGKTGTTDSFRDSWFAGYSDNLLAIVWVGRDDNRPTGLSGSGGAMRVWENVMLKIELGIPEPRLNDDIVFADIDIQTGLVANNRCSQRQTLPFVRGTQPEVFAPCSGLAAKMRSWFSIKRHSGEADDGDQVEVSPIENYSESRP